MKYLAIFLGIFLALSFVSAQSYNSNIDLSAYGVDGNVQVNPDGSVKADIDVKSNFQGNVNGNAVNSQSDAQYNIDAKAGDEVKLNGTVKDSNGNVMASESVTYDIKNVKSGEKIVLSNGKNSEVKIMPSTASANAIAKLSIKVCSTDNNCTIILKETGSGDNIKLTYEVKANKQFKILGIFKSNSEVKAEVDVETGDVVKVKRPWWSFVASEKAE